jgi:hypothetical protein
VVGRAGLFRELDRALGEARSVSVVGDWRIGKTTILETWGRKVEGSGRVVKRLTGEGPEGVSIGAFVRTVTGLDATDNADQAAGVLDQWVGLAARPGLPPVLLIDESDAIVRNFDPRFFERLRGMLGRIVLVFASRQELDKVSQKALGVSSPIHGRLALQPVGLLEPDAAEELMRRGEPVLNQDDQDLMRRWAGRHPFHLQLLGYHLVAVRQAGEPVPAALDRYRIEAAARFREIWRVLEEREQSELKATVDGAKTTRLSLRVRGLVTEEGLPFGESLVTWLREEL